MTVCTVNHELALICPDPIIGINRQGLITLFNPAAEVLLGYSKNEMIGHFHIGKLYHPYEAAKEVKRLMYSTEHGKYGQIQNHETHLLSKQGKLIPIRISATVLSNNDEEIGSVGFFHDLSETKALQESLKQLSITDSLTGLYNQRHFHTLLGTEIERSKRYQHALSLICIDMDNFKAVNDSLGHLEGDSLLRFVGDTLKNLLRDSDSAFRYGGDEFMLVLPETDAEEAAYLAGRIIDSFESQKSGVLTEYNKTHLPVGLSIGISETVPDEDANLFIKRADLAMYQAKKVVGCSIYVSS